YVGLYAAILDQPLAIETVEREFRTRDVSAVHERYIAANASHATPRPLTDERAQFVLLEEVAEKIAIRRGIMIGNARHVPMENVGRDRSWLPVARWTHSGQHSAQAREDKLVDETTAVIADVEYDAFFANLRE